MTYIDDDSIIKCNLDALYSGDFLLEASPEVAEIIGCSEGAVEAPKQTVSSYLASMKPASGTLPGWDVVDRICGD